VSRLFTGDRIEACIAGCQAGRAAQPFYVDLDGGLQQVAVGGPLIVDLKMSDDLILGLPVF
jgi:NaMN:DMB phosphoribosyltransferase